jgi:hypothetical protein
VIGLTDRQLSIVMTAAAPLPPEKRAIYLQRVIAALHFRCAGRRFDDDDVVDVCVSPVTA